MKDAEIRERLEAARQDIIYGNVDAGLTDIERLEEDLEANPPLAEVEGWIEVPSDLNWIPQSFYTLTSGRAWKPQIAVTVTIRKKHEG